MEFCFGLCSGQNGFSEEARCAREIGVLKAGETKEARWKVKITDPSKFEAEVSLRSTRGGVEKIKVALPPGL